MFDISIAELIIITMAIIIFVAPKTFLITSTMPIRYIANNGRLFLPFFLYCNVL